MNFYCREKELQKMNNLYDSGEWECVVIYGRRRIGKTALINEFCKGKKTIYFSALNASASENLRALSKSIYVCEHEDCDDYPVYESFEKALQRVGRMGLDERLVFVIDEYPYLAKSDSSISSRLQHLIDHSWQESKLYFIICGSSMSFMQHQVLGYESPLYGRRTAQFKIEALTYKETAAFNPSLSCEESACIYGITGGVPHYINKLRVRDSLDGALISKVFDSSGYLFEEPENLLKQELREPALYNSIIRAIAEGATKLNEIATKVGLESGPCAKYVNVLMELGIVKKENPMTERYSKRTIYIIEDNFFRFWFKFVPPNLSAISFGNFMPIYEKAVKACLHDYMGTVFEKMCKDYLMRYADDLPFYLTDIGQWWGTDKLLKKQVQIDIVGVPVQEPNQKNERYLIGSCKFKNEKIGVEELKLLKHYAEVFGKGKEYFYVIFSLGGFTDELKKLTETDSLKLVTLEEMYGKCNNENA